MINEQDEKMCNEYLSTLTLEDVFCRASLLPEGVEIYIVGGLANRGFTRHDIDMWIIDHTKTDKNLIDLMVAQAFLGGAGRDVDEKNIERVYLNEYENKILEPSLQKLRKGDKTICKNIYPYLQIHSHCKDDEIERNETECNLKLPENNPALNYWDKTVRCTKNGCINLGTLKTQDTQLK